MTDAQFSVSWDAYQKSICNGLGLMQQRGEFVDMTIAADGHHVKVHQMVLSLVSPYIKELITSAATPHPVIFLNRVSHETLQSVLEYAYTGEVMVAQEKLSDFLEACKALNIKGLENMSRSFENSTNGDIDLIEEKMQDTSPVQTSKSFHHQYLTSINNTEMEDHIDESYECTNDDDHEDGDFDVQSKNVPTKKAAKEKYASTGSSMLQYTVSCHGSLQIVLNRYMYMMRYTRKDNAKKWLCINARRGGCQASVITKGDEVLQRLRSHNHTYHDEQILKRVNKGNMFTALHAAEYFATDKKRNPSNDSDVVKNKKSKFL